MSLTPILELVAERCDQDHIYDAAVRWAEVAPITVKAKGDFVHSYRKQGKIHGMTQICQYWHATGHFVSPLPIALDVVSHPISQNEQGGTGLQIRKTKNSYRGAFRFLREIAVLASFCTTLLSVFDPLQHTLLKELTARRLNSEEAPEQKGFESYVRGLLWEDIEVVYNRLSPPHFDRNDPHWAWACIIYFGTFETAFFDFPQLGLRIYIRPGDVVFFRAKDLLHAVPNWGDGERYFVIFFTHEATWRDFDMAGHCASGKSRFV